MLFLKYTQAALYYRDLMAKLTIVNYLSSFTNLNEIYARKTWISRKTWKIRKYCNFVA